MPPPPSSETKRPPPSFSFDPDDGPDRESDAPRGWVSEQVHVMAAAWARGEPISAAAILAEHPELDAESAVRLIYEEICLRRDAGEDVATIEVVNQYPQFRDELEVLLSCDRILRPLGRPAILPEVGENLGSFHLLAELGRGASGKTFLATEPSLANRLVVLKVLSDDQDEHLSLARLQHTHIIPLFSEQEFPERGLRALCMPYLGGASLARILEVLAETTPAPENRRGRNFLDAVQRIQKERPPTPISDSPYRRYLEQASYVQSVCWVAACLADALHEAHAHGLIHMDVKPSNVLIAADGQPLLLDFHLARKRVEAGERVSDRLGGTPDWMAPEQRLALTAVTAGRPAPATVDHRADLYALGLLLCDALGGSAAAKRAAGGKPWNRSRSVVSLGLEDVIQKCLEPRPSDRYCDAASVADDLRRHANDLPLRGVPNRSLAERWSKWRRRQPRGLSRNAAWAFAVAAVAIALLIGRAYYYQRLADIEADLKDGVQLQAQRRFTDAARVLDRGLQRAATTPGADRLRGDLSAERQRALRGRKADELHRLADIVRFRHYITSPVKAEAQRLVRDVQAAWEGRDFLLGRSSTPLAPEVERDVRADLLDLVLTWTDARVRLAAPDHADEARRQALEILDEAEPLCGPSLALNQQRRDLARALRQPESPGPPDPSPHSAREHCDLGRSLLRSGAFQQAAVEFQRAVELQPEDFWPNFYEGLCAYRLERFNEAVAAFRCCIALAPTTAECYYNRALAESALGRPTQAFRDYSRALDLDAKLTDAALNRGILSYESHRYDEAIADFNRALAATADTAALGRIHYNLALAHLARGDRAEAIASADEALAHGYNEARALRDGLNRAARPPR
ncbi:MAG: serine/threonine-protein kinase [Paludisphaera borealis]|uniref:serine/threonine-protein kinase n=1 Tax=Paludisphaera borealis TaxID=1387353 RepID=UPI002850E105|nr:serine/threonine-protein kinase [Paludisphaera borealis]MDR3622669.1 serine/threonine-protein kinase [Paludisphaera borealis]